jgi:hypothetical protein
MENNQSYPADGVKQIIPKTETSPFVKVENKAKELLEKVAGIKYVDEDWGQLDYYSQSPPVKWPCTLIDVSNADFTDKVRNRHFKPQMRQDAQCVLTIRLANLKLSNSSHKAPATQKAHAAHIKELAQLIHTDLQGVCLSDNASGLKRRRMQRQMRDDGIQEYVLMYAFELGNV